MTNSWARARATARGKSDGKEKGKPSAIMRSLVRVIVFALDVGSLHDPNAQAKRTNRKSNVSANQVFGTRQAESNTSIAFDEAVLQCTEA